MSDLITKSSSQISHSKNDQGHFHSDTPTADIHNLVILSTLNKLEEKVDHLQSTMEGIPVKVVGLLEQMWLTKGEDFMKMCIGSLERVSQVTVGDCNLNEYPTTPLVVGPAESSLWVQQVFPNGHHEEPSQCIQPAFTDGPLQQNQGAQPVFSDGQSPARNLCIQPVFNDENDTTHQSVKLEPVENEQEENQDLQQVLCSEHGLDWKCKPEPVSPGSPGSDESNELDPLHPFEHGPHKPSAFLGSDSPSADEAVCTDSLARRNANSEMPLCKATTDHGPITKTENLQIDPIGEEHDQRHTCEECGENFTDQMSLERHLSCHECKYCNQMFVQHSQLLTHLKSHRKEEEFMCRICDKFFAGKRSLSAHKRLHSGERRYKCTECERSFVHSSNLNRHKLIHTQQGGEFACGFCGKCFSSKTCLTAHTNLHTGEKPFKCTECEESFTHYQYLARHQQVHAPQMEEAVMCGKSLTSKTALNAHTTCHIERCYKCTMCEKSFTHSSYLNRHQRIHTQQAHTKEEAFICGICGKSLASKSSLTAHTSLHTGEK
ncbi:zinc finger protein 2-like [Ambystoma mexicanum]|uniref:zinc finger protein 2-like n=1 Tax=Ambystoma mexicanum TaxID=8296 RepID=UPI0037E8274E